MGDKNMHGDDDGALLDAVNGVVDRAEQLADKALGQVDRALHITSYGLLMVPLVFVAGFSFAWTIALYVTHLGSGALPFWPAWLGTGFAVLWLPLERLHRNRKLWEQNAQELPKNVLMTWVSLAGSLAVSLLVLAIS